MGGGGVPGGGSEEMGPDARGYKGVARRQVLRASYETLVERAPWLDLTGHRELLIADDNAFDAVITALIARAATLGGTHRPDDNDRPIAQREGWIHVPDISLSDLV